MLFLIQAKKTSLYLQLIFSIGFTLFAIYWLLPIYPGGHYTGSLWLALGMYSMVFFPMLFMAWLNTYITARVKIKIYDNHITYVSFEKSIFRSEIKTILLEDIEYHLCDSGIDEVLYIMSKQQNVTLQIQRWVDKKQYVHYLRVNKNLIFHKNLKTFRTYFKERAQNSVS